MKKALSLLFVGFAMTLTATSYADWRTEASATAQDLAASIEALDEVLHEVAEEKGPAFQEAVERIHHVEQVVIELSNEILVAPYAELCGHFSHLYHDLVDMRSYLIHLGLQSHPEVVRRWNEMVHVYNSRLRHYFNYCQGHNAIVPMM